MKAELTVTVKLVEALACPSLTVSAIVAVPLWFTVGAIVTVRLGPFPPNTMFPSETSDWLEEALLKVSLLNGVSMSAIVNRRGPVESPGLRIWFGMLVIVGGSFTALTVRTKLVLVLSDPSLTVRVIIAVPFSFGDGFTVTVRFAPLPPKTMLCTSVGFEEMPVTARSPGVV